MNRRDFLAKAALTLAAALSWPAPAFAASGRWVNDIHAHLNETHVAEVLRPLSASDVVRYVQASKLPMSVAGAQHAAGRQQFCTDGAMFTMLGMAAILRVADGTVEAEAGIQWPALLESLRLGDWTVAQKQGIAGLTLGGTLGANAHGRGIHMPPIVNDIESFRIVTANGRERVCSRTQNSELFSLAIGGYGLFGVMTSVRLRLQRKGWFKAWVQMVDVDDLLARLADHTDAQYGSYQLNIDPTSPSYLQQGVLSFYKPTSEASPPWTDGDGDSVPMDPLQEATKAFVELACLCHVQPGAAFERFATDLLARHGKTYSTEDELGDDFYVQGYHKIVDERLHAEHEGSDVLVEFYLPRSRFAQFCKQVAADFRDHEVRLFYVTVRFIEADQDTFLPWAQNQSICIAFNIHTDHTPAGIEHTAATFRRLLDLTIAAGGSYYLTYHAWATREQLLACYPQFPQFLSLKRKYDPDERFQSDWYRHYRSLLA